MHVVDPNTDRTLPQPQYDPDRPRHWLAHILGDRSAPERHVVIVRRYAILADGEDLTENPPQHELTWAEWLGHHGDYGLDVDGQPLAAESVTP